MSETTVEVPSFDIEKVRQYADEVEKQGGFVYCFRGEVPTKRDNYIGKEAAGTWYTEKINGAVGYLKDRERSSGEIGNVYSVVVPKSTLDSREPIDAARFMVNIHSSITQGKTKLSDEEVQHFIDQQRGSVDPIVANKQQYLSQFEPKKEKP